MSPKDWRCRGINTPALFAPDWDSSEVPPEAPHGIGPKSSSVQLPLNLYSCLASFSLLPCATSPFLCCAFLLESFLINHCRTNSAAFSRPQGNTGPGTAEGGVWERELCVLCVPGWPLSLQRGRGRKGPHSPVSSVALEWMELLTELSDRIEWAWTQRPWGPRVGILGHLLLQQSTSARVWEPPMWHGAGHTHGTGGRPAIARQVGQGKLRLSVALLKSLAPFPELPLWGEEKNKLCSRCPATKAK